MTTSFVLTPVEQAAGVGAALGLGASFLMLRKPTKTELIGATLLGAVAGAVIAKAAAPAPALAAAPVNLTVSPPGTYAITPSLGQTVNIALPTGGAWTSNNGVPLSGSTPISWVYQGPGKVTLTWTDSTGAAQTTVFQFSTSAV
jgi:hypothetical protein